MNGLISAIFVLITAINANREPWIEPLPGVRVEPTCAERLEKSFQPDSAYRLLVAAGQLPVEDTTTAGLGTLVHRLELHPWPVEPPGLFDGDQPWDARECVEVRALLKALEPNVALARRAVAASEPRVPTLTAIDDLLPYLFPARKVGRLLVISASVKGAEGNSQGAFDDLLLCVRFGNILSRGGVLINRLVDHAVSNLATGAMWRITVRRDVPPDVLRRAGLELLAIADRLEPAAETMRYECRFWVLSVDFLYQSGFGAFMGTPSQGSRKAWFVLPIVGALCGSNRADMKQDFRHLGQHVIAAAEKPWHADTKAELDKVLAQARTGPSIRFIQKKNPVGLMLGDLLVPGIPAAMTKLTEHEATLRGTALFLAISAYEKEMGVPPKVLDDLVPKYLPRVPVDPFDGKPLRYRTGDVPKHWGDVKWGVYSIGSDFTDDGGDANRCVSTRYAKPKRGESPDIVWLPEPFPEAPPAEKTEHSGGLFGAP